MKHVIIANWKMNPATLKEASSLFGSVKKKATALRNAEIVIAPSFLSLAEFSKKSGAVKLAAQDVFLDDPPGGIGPFTGEISSQMLKAAGVSYVIVGHSERREKLGESDEVICMKLKSVFSRSLKAVLCVGEKEKAESGFPDAVKMQLKAALSSLPRRFASRLLVVYEPIWAISTRKGAKADSPKNLFEMAIFIRRILLDIWGKKAALKIPILYGGSVNSKNVKSFLEVEGVKGLLIGGASLNQNEFGKILDEVRKI